MTEKKPGALVGVQFNVLRPNGKAALAATHNPHTDEPRDIGDLLDWEVLLLMPVLQHLVEFDWEEDVAEVCHSFGVTQESAEVLMTDGPLSPLSWWDRLRRAVLGDSKDDLELRAAEAFCSNVVLSFHQLWTQCEAYPLTVPDMISLYHMMTLDESPGALPVSREAGDCERISKTLDQFGEALELRLELAENITDDTTHTSLWERVA